MCIRDRNKLGAPEEEGRPATARARSLRDGHTEASPAGIPPRVRHRPLSWEHQRRGRRKEDHQLGQPIDLGRDPRHGQAPADRE
eukprot:4536905-Alexandrium_andersonii.AAC.1